MRRIPRRWVALLTVAVAVVGVATLGNGRNGPAGQSAADVERYLQAQRADAGAPGTAVGIVQGDTTSTAGFGDVGPDSLFVIGSVTKSFTALAVMQLVEAGRVRLDDPVTGYLPYFRTHNQDVSRTITVRQLLTQTSGLSTAAGEDPFQRPETTLEDQVRQLRDVVAAPPGTFEYSNANYEVLGQLVAQVSHQTYGQYLQDHVLGPLQMHHTFTDLTSARAAGLQGGHQIWFGLAVPDNIYYRADWLPAGFLVSTAGDLNHYISAFLNGGHYHSASVLSATGIHTLTSIATDASGLGRHKSYGLGWFQERVGGRDLVYVPGSAHNYHADIVLVPDRHAGVVVLQNAETSLYFLIPKFDLLAFNAAAIATGSPPQGTVRGLYLVADLLLACMLFFYSRNLIRVLRRRTPGFTGQSKTRRAFTLWRELIAPAAIAVGLPRQLGLPWSVLVRTDLGLVLALVPIMGLSTLVARLVFLRSNGQATRDHTQGGGTAAARAPSRARQAPTPKRTGSTISRYALGPRSIGAGRNQTHQR